MSGTLDALNAVDNTEEPAEETPEVDETPDEETPVDDEEPTEDEPDPAESEEDEAPEEEQEEEEDNPQASKLAKDLSTKYKGILKEVPQLRGVLFREQKFRELFPTVDDAVEAEGESRAFRYLENTVGTGNSEVFIETLDEESLGKFAKSFIPNLAKKDPKLANEAFVPVINGFLRKVKNDAARAGNKQLGAAVQFISHFLNGSAEVPEHVEEKEDPKLAKERADLEKERQSLANEKFTTFRNRIVTRGDKAAMTVIKAAIEKRDTSLSDLEKDALAERTFKRVMENLGNDEEHIRAIDSLWKQAKKQGYSEEWIPRIMNAMLGGARSLIPGVLAKVRAESLKRKMPKNEEAGIGTGAPGKTGTKTGKLEPIKGKVPAGTTTLDLFNGAGKGK